MAFVDWKCPECGRDIRVDSTKQSCFCNVCGTKLEIAHKEETVQKTEPSQPTAPSGAPTAQTKSEKPGAGKTVASFALCWFIAAGTCASTSLLLGVMGGSLGPDSPYGNVHTYSTGGLLTFAFGIVAASRFSKEGRLGGAAGFAFVSGVIIGVIAGLIGPMLFAMRWG